MMLEKSCRHGYITHVGKLAPVDPTPIAKHRNQVITAARELGYGESVIAKLKKATTKWEMSEIMGNARRSMMK